MGATLFSVLLVLSLAIDAAIVFTPERLRRRAAIALGIPLGIAAARFRRAGQVELGAIGMLQTVPALALLVFMIPLFGMIQRMVIMTTFARAFSLLVESGIHIKDVLHLLKGLSENIWYRKIIAESMISDRPAQLVKPAVASNQFAPPSVVLRMPPSLVVRYSTALSRASTASP